MISGGQGHLERTTIKLFWEAVSDGLRDGVRYERVKLGSRLKTSLAPN